MASLSCPRCDVALTPPPESFDTNEVTHGCAQCLGGWVDGVNVGVAFPALRHHGRRLAELQDAGAREVGCRCPRCREAMLEFPFFDLWLDLCERCHGLWVDGHETSFVQKNASSEDGLPERRAGSGYRAHARPVVTEERVACVECQREVHPRRTLLTGDGPVCDGCVEVSKMSEALRAESGLKPLARWPGAVLRLIGRVLDLDGKRLTRNAPK